MAEPRVYRQFRFQPPPGATELVVVRHGESEVAVEGQSFELVDGHGDPPLSEEGREQARRVGERLAVERFDAIYVTTLRRTAETAAPLAERLGLEPIVERDLREVFLGDWEGGLFRQKVMEQDPIAVQAFLEQRWEVIPGAESAASLGARVRAAIDRIAAAHTDGRVALFVHGGIIGEILAQASGSQPFAFGGADNGSISHVVVQPEAHPSDPHGRRWIVRRYNDTAHLDPALTVRPTPLE